MKEPASSLSSWLFIEAWSRGAASVCWVESSPRTYAVLQDNLTTLCGAEVGQDGEQVWKAVRSDVFHSLGGLRKSTAYDIVFADPPYDLARDGRWGLRLLEDLAAGELLAPGGFLVLEQAREDGELVHLSWTLVTTKVYGGTRLTIYRKGKDV